MVECNGENCARFTEGRPSWTTVEENYTEIRVELISPGGLPIYHACIDSGEVGIANSWRAVHETNIY